MTKHACVTANLQGGRPTKTSAWLRSALLLRPALVFGQEYSRYREMRDLAAEHGYVSHMPTRPVLGHRWAGSWLLTRGDIACRPLFSVHLPYLDFFGTYVAGTRLDWPGAGEVTVLSVHASPRPVPFDRLDTWPGERPTPRLATDAITRPLYFVDLLLGLMTQLCDVGPVFSAGDFNEARERDVHGRPGWLNDRTYGREFYERTREAGFVDLTYREWGEERRTLFHEGLPPYQSDHVLATPEVAALLSDPVIDPGWRDGSFNAREHADHAPLWFRAATADASVPEAIRPQGGVDASGLPAAYEPRTPVERGPAAPPATVPPMTGHQPG